MIRKIQLNDTYLMPILVSWTGIYMGLCYVMTIMCHITNGIRITASWNIGIINIYKCTKSINKSHPTINQINFNINRYHSRIIIYTCIIILNQQFRETFYVILVIFVANVFNIEGVYYDKLHQILFRFDQLHMLSVSKLHNMLNMFIFLMFLMLY